MYKGISRKHKFLAILGLVFGATLISYESVKFIQVKMQADKAVASCGIGNVESVSTRGFQCFTGK